MNDISWQSELQQSITEVHELCRTLAIPLCSAPTDYPLFVPKSFVDLMEQGNLNDPLLLQVLPLPEENDTIAGFSKDPLGEMTGVQQCFALNKYASRTLLLVSGECGIHCRFCFRRHFPKVPSPDLETLLAPIRNDSTIEEVILSGGDPLMLSDDALDNLLQSILRIKHIQRVRIHSRLPVVLPSRLTSTLAEILTLPIPVYLVLHVNHPRELSNEFLQRREWLTKPVVLAQTVLLRRVNDNSETLYQLFRRLIDARILPYYLHQLDRVAGSSHFEVSSEEGLRILAALRERLPGYALPLYVREVSGKNCKEMILS